MSLKAMLLNLTGAVVRHRCRQEMKLDIGIRLAQITTHKATRFKVIGSTKTTWLKSQRRPIFIRPQSPKSLYNDNGCVQAC
ncbi:MAG: hypothetical protein CM15mP120_22910 [Pseudomonadota bacterium]|nr:MAG: hypothetical protein CM15mP120_22910 [Pseudomonadota bacterium]